MRHLLWVLFVGLLAMPALSCECGSAKPPLRGMAQADAVFTGKVLSLKKIFVPGSDAWTHWKTPMVEAEIRVAKSIKGNLAKNVTILTGGGGGDCGYSFAKGKSYLVYAFKGFNGNGKLETNICTRTQQLEPATNNELLELQGRLPVPKIPAANPTIELRGTIADGGYHGYVFILWNRLHDRIFYFRDGPLVQVNVAGRWENYPMNDDVSPREELSDEAAKKLLDAQSAGYKSREADGNAEFVNRLEGEKLFLAKPTSTLKWRIGFQYVTEAELDAGKKIQDSAHFVWSEPIDETMKLKALSFKEGLGPGWLPYPLGTGKP
jgi:hypothetical protein